MRVRVPEALCAKRKDGRVFEQPIEPQLCVGGGLGPPHRATHEPCEETVWEEADLIEVRARELSRAVERLESADLSNNHGQEVVSEMITVLIF